MSHTSKATVLNWRRMRFALRELAASAEGRAIRRHRRRLLAVYFIAAGLCLAILLST